MHIQIFLLVSTTIMLLAGPGIFHAFHMPLANLISSSGFLAMLLIWFWIFKKYDQALCGDVDDINYFIEQDLKNDYMLKDVSYIKINSATSSRSYAIHYITHKGGEVVIEHDQVNSSFFQKVWAVLSKYRAYYIALIASIVAASAILYYNNIEESSSYYYFIAIGLPYLVMLIAHMKYKMNIFDKQSIYNAHNAYVKFSYFLIRNSKHLHLIVDKNSPTIDDIVSSNFEKKAYKTYSIAKFNYYMLND